MMASTGLKRALDLALELPREERASLAHDLLASLDGEADPDGAQAWEKEIARRLDVLDSGQATIVKTEEALRSIDDRLRR